MPDDRWSDPFHIINVSSVYGHRLGPDATVYCATKFAVRALSEGLRQEVKPYNIRTTVISPGAVATELLEHITEKEIQAQTKDFVGQIAIAPDSFARMVAFAVNEPEEVDVNEILFRPTAQPICSQGGILMNSLLATTSSLLLLGLAEGGPRQTINPGDVVWTDPGVRHWHGATLDRAMTHIAVQEQVDGTSVKWMEPVTDEQYVKATP